MYNLIRTVLAIPIAILLLTVFAAILTFLIFIGYVVAVIYMPTRAYKYFQHLADYRKMQRNG